MNNKNEVTITVSGSAGTGKSVFMTEIIKMLDSHNIEYVVESLDYDKERFINDSIVDRAMPTLRERVKIKVVEQQTHRRTNLEK